MSILERQGQMSNWGSELKTSFNKNCFSEYSIAFPCLSKEQIDLAIMSSKYGFKEIVLSDDVMMTKEIISASMTSSYTDENRLLSDILNDRYRATTIIDKSIKSSDTIVSLIKPNDVIDFALINYGPNMRLCQYSLFDKKSLNDETVSRFATNINVLSDVVFGIANGFYE